MTQEQPFVATHSVFCYLQYCYRTLVLSVTLLCVFSVPFASIAFAEQRPKIGVVLGGGGAKGAAHIGVLKALEDLQIPVDYIAGTSMGAYVGGLYATGMSADEIEALLTSVDWEQGYQDRVMRGDRRVREKQQEDRYQITSELGFGFWELKAPRGIVQGQTMGAILRSTSGNLPVFDSFDQLVIPYRAVATDIENLEPVVLDKGDLAEVMQASMSIPGLLPPKEVKGKLLVDGGITDNLPIEVVRNMGADIIIAVDISNEFKKRDELNTYFAVMDQLTDFMVRYNADRQIALLSDKDFLIRPNIRGINTADFARMPLAFESGYVEVMAMADELNHLGRSTWFQDYVDNKQKRRRHLVPLDERVVDEIRLENNSSYADGVLLDRLELEAGKAISSEELDASVSSLYALDRFERVDYRIEKIDGENVILLNVEEKSWGPNFIDFRFALEDDFENSTDYSFGMAFNVTGLSRAGAEWRTELEYGSDKRIATGLYLPFVKDHDWFSLITAEYKNTDYNIPLFGEEPALEDIDIFIPANYTDTIFDASFGWQPKLWQEFRMGMRYISGETEVLGFPNFGVDKRKSQVGYIRYSLDTLDDFMLPKQGNLLELELAASDDKSRFDGSEFDDFSVHFDMNWKGAVTYGDHTFMGKAEYGRVSSDFDLRLDPKELGGFLNLSGIPKNSLSGNNKIFTAAIYRYNLTEQDFGLFKSSVFFGGSVEYGGVYNNSDLNFKDVPLYTAGSLYSGITTPVGPLILAYGRTEQSNHAFYVFFGGAL
ncbi:patatin-like phospholipase family protein [Photobacterium sp. ZSDE20]|uniref:Patatin-like phospholipase family protein n=1 Tax=Photobacterium pectinilyticum TaxID=2906793 RepID=A0ABT1MXW8_9GAMM|nr:patatin-like phospholipase family protein [Photobacterium sp. ZSDE20]MCQ1057214.1 patatin-like phospholipase family protein [Photobacterium sp. ZSDE20]MDD1821348.1 patatin-like phospholipase family protein [Photobacterium sp. ZSDE20]